MLEQPNFRELAWTSLQPAMFNVYYWGGSADWIKEYQKTGKQSKLVLMADQKAGVAVIDPADVGKVAGKLLSLDDASSHNRAKYVLVGPQDVSG